MTITALNPVETPEVRFALVEAYKAIGVLDEMGYLDYLAEQFGDVKAVEQARAARDAVLAGMSPNLLVTVLPAYTKVRFATDRNIDGQTQEGLLRDGAWGLYTDRSNSTERRITTNGWEFFVNLETEFTYFEILEIGK